MKVIDLLNKIANGEEVPKKIKYNADVYIHVGEYCYFCEETNEILSQNVYAEFNRLNDEVEIIEEEQDIEEIRMCTGGIMGFDGVENITGALKEKINELIKAVNKLKNK